jgi:diketogulonate reductase-like aldo/keto reductase
MAYSPIEQGRLRLDALRPIAAKHGVEPFTAALAFVLRRGDVIAIPKASSAAHVEANRKAAEVALDAADLQALDRAFPPPRRKVPLEMI